MNKFKFKTMDPECTYYFGSIQGMSGTDYAKVDIIFYKLGAKVKIADGSVVGSKNQVWLDPEQLATFQRIVARGFSFIVYGNFTDPTSNYNFVEVTMPWGAPFRKVVSAVKAAVKPWYTKRKGDPFFIGVDQEANTKNVSVTKFKWVDGNLTVV